MPNWTSQQLTAIENRGRSVIVSAAAGSGKTTVLVERLIRLLSDTEHPVRADSIVVVTFTNDAAANMKQSLTAELEKKMKSDIDDKTYEWLFQQSARLHNAKISTINAFCFQLIRENADACGIGAGFQIIEPSEESAYIKNAMENTLKIWCNNRSEDMAYLCETLCSRGDEELSDIVFRISRDLDSLAFPEIWMHRAEAVCGDAADLFCCMQQEAVKELSQIIRFAEFSEDAACSAGDAFGEIWKRDIESFRKLYQYLKDASMDTVLSDSDAGRIVFEPMSKKRNHIDEDEKAVFSEFRSIYKNWYTAFYQSYFADLKYIISDAQIQEKVIPLLIALTREFRAEVLRLKIENNVLCFSDGEQLALELLGEVQEDGTITQTPLGRQLSEYYKIIMLDEYQDSNNKQDCLFKLLSCGGYYSTEKQRLQYGNNAFLVGDVKQSIYRFRQANPKNFIDALDDSTPAEQCGESDTARIYLNQNFRSSEGVIAFVNTLFRSVMTPECGEVLYDENESLVFGAEALKGLPNVRTKVIFPFQGDTPLPDGTDLQAECTASTIHSMLKQKLPVLDKKGFRPCKPADFCILVRNNKVMYQLRSALQKYGISSGAEQDGAFLSSPEIRLIVNFLHILDNPLTDLPMTAVLFSPIYGFTGDELLTLKNTTNVTRLYRQIFSYIQNQKLKQTVLYQKCKQFLNQFYILRDAAETMPLDALIHRIYEETDMLSLMGLYDDAENRRSRLERFPQIAKGFSTRYDNGSCLGAWLRQLDSMYDQKKDFSENTSDAVNENSVHIKTIHGSKGLEYPFVFLVYANTKFNLSERREPFCTDETGRIGLQFFDKSSYQRFKTVTHGYIIDKRIHLQKSEELRLLYVALTRAKQQLTVIADSDYTMHLCRGSAKKKENLLKASKMLRREPDSLPFLALHAKSMLDWIIWFLLSRDEGDYLLSALQDGTDAGTELVEFSAWTARNPENADDTRESGTTAEADATILDDYKKQIESVYFSSQSKKLSKHSVTSIAHPEQLYTDFLAEPQFMKEDAEKKHGLQGAVRGTAVHKIMQIMDFQKGADNPEAEIQRLLSEGRLTQAEADAISPDSLLAFFASPLYQRMLSAEKLYREKQLFVEIGSLHLPEDFLEMVAAGNDSILIGTVDVVFRDADGWVIVDYKTDRGKSAEALAEHYRMQVLLYQRAMEVILGEPVREAYLYSFSLNQTISIQCQPLLDK